MTDPQTQINKLEGKIDSLESRIREQDGELSRLQDFRKNDMSVSHRGHLLQPS